MSHYLVAVITKGKPTAKMIEKALAPYQENNMGDCPKEYLKFNSTREDCIGRYNEWTRTMYRDTNGSLYRYNEKQFEKPIKAEDRHQYSEWHSSNGGEYFMYDYTGYTKVDIPYKDIWATVDEYLKEYCDDEWNEEAQDYGYWKNPNAKWDWYQIGGRYAGCIQVNKKKAVDYAYGEKSLFYGIENPYTEDGDIICVDSARVKDIIQHFHAYAVLTKDGEWHEAGAMGLFGISCADADKKRKFEEEYKQFVFANAEDDDFLTLVDCHI